MYQDVVEYKIITSEWKKEMVEIKNIEYADKIKQNYGNRYQKQKGYIIILWVRHR